MAPKIETLTINNRQFRVVILPQEPNTSSNGIETFIVGRWEEKLGAISQAATIDELLSNMADAIQLMEDEIGKEPSGFWIRRTVDKDKNTYSPNSWQKCVQLMESSGYRLSRETEKHKKFRSPTTARGIRGMNLGGLGGPNV